MGENGGVLHLRISTSSALSGAVQRLLERDEAVSSLAVLRGASILPEAT